jgi:hypothetical protein
MASSSRRSRSSRRSGVLSLSMLVIFGSLGAPALEFLSVILPEAGSSAPGISTCSTSPSLSGKLYYIRDFYLFHRGAFYHLNCSEMF